MTMAATVGTRLHVWRALGWMSCALASFSAVAITGRAASQGATTLEVMFYRCFISLTIVLAVVLLGPGLGGMRTSRLTLHALRALIHFIGQYAWLAALLMIPLAQLFALEFTAPIWVALFAPLFLGERLTRTRVLAALLGFAGLLVVARPGAMALEAGVVLALVSAVSFALSMTCTKALSQGEGPMRILFYMIVFQTPMSLMLAPFGMIRIPDWTTFGWITLLALAALLAQYALVRAFALADAVVVAPMDFFRLPLIAIVGAILYAEPFEPLVLLGGAIVIAGNALNLWGERRGIRGSVR